jgi:hypothetical protein
MALASPLQLDDLSVLKEKVYGVVYEYFRPDVITGEFLAKSVSEAAVKIVQNFEPPTTGQLVLFWIYIATVMVFFGVAVMTVVRAIIQHRP